MTWIVVVPAAWLITALALGLLVGRCIRRDADVQPAAEVAAARFTPPTAMAAPTADRDHSLARTV